ncbi:MAG: NAD(P)-dependent oxidoreductase, partial [Synergistaceae bacterium]|nr:NAD(P)-dependent oxidoreductase [Synergistaceae bacterium]
AQKIKVKKNEKEVRVVDDQIGAPTWARFVAQSTVMTLPRAMELGTAASGVYHITAGGSASWYDFAREILERAASTGRYDFGGVGLKPISAAEYPASAARPRWSVLSMEKAGRAFGVYPAPWRESVGLCLDEIKER